MNGFRILQVVIVAVGVMVYAWRHHSLLELKSERKSLEKASITAPAVGDHAVAATPSTNGALSHMERNELLRLRGQVGVLRRDLLQETNRQDDETARR
jgi:hypothetical protein